MQLKILTLISLIFISFCSPCQEKIKLRADSIVEIFIQKIGGNKWKNLNSRVEKGIVEYHEEGESSNIITKTSSRNTYYLAPSNYLDFQNSFFLEKRVMCFKPDCNWFYSEKGSLVKFFGPDIIQFNDDFPRTEMLEVLNLKMKDKVYKVDSLFRVDFKDLRQKDGIQSLYFSIKTGLLVKRVALSKNDVIWEFQFSDFRENDGLKDAYKIDLFANEEPYFTINIDSIQYDKDLESSMFDPPVDCKNKDSYEILETLFYPEFFQEQ